MMLITAFLICASPETPQFKAMRDSVIQDILAGNDSCAIIKVEKNICGHPNDYLLLGYLSYAYDDITLQDLPDNLKLLCRLVNKDVIKAWETFLCKHKNNIPTLEIACHLTGTENETKARSYACQIIKLDSLNPCPALINGIFEIIKNRIDSAFLYFRQSYSLDSTYVPTLRCLRKIHFKLGNYDSVLAYNMKIMNRSLKPKIINELILNSVILYLKLRSYDQAEELLQRYNKTIEDDVKVKTVSDIRKYIDNIKKNIKSPKFTFIYSPEWDIAAILSADSIAVYEYNDIFSPAEVIRYSQPKYPEAARIRGVEGIAILMILVDEKGTVEDAYVAISSGYEVLDQAALDAIWQTRLKPATVFEKPIKIWVAHPSRFVLK
jgi:protein TonB